MMLAENKLRLMNKEQMIQTFKAHSLKEVLHRKVIYLAMGLIILIQWLIKLQRTLIMLQISLRKLLMSMELLKKLNTSNLICIV